MRAPLIAYFVSLLVFFGLDLAWLSMVMGSIYKTRLGPLLLDKPNFAVGGVFYVAYAIGIAVFAVMPAVGQESWLRALALGALFGLMAYGTYDLTNLATLKGWSPAVSLLDVAWGTLATGVAGAVGYLAVRRFGG